MGLPASAHCPVTFWPASIQSTRCGKTNKQRSSPRVLRVPASLEIKLPGRGMALSLHSPCQAFSSRTGFQRGFSSCPQPPVLPKYPIPASCLPTQPRLNGTAARGTPGAQPGVAEVEEWISARTQVSAKPFNQEF